MKRAIVLHSNDTVATLIDSARAGETCVLEGERAGEIRLQQDVPFGHKVCVIASAVGAEVLKYGQVIGCASLALGVGEHVHVHNLQSARGRGDLVKG